jgi:subtilisin family serine protease
MAENRCVVTLHKGVDTARFCEEMTATYGNDFIPNRSVELVNEKPDSISNFDFILTDIEYATLKNDPRVRDIRWGSKAENGLIPEPFVIEPPRNHNRDNTTDNTDYPWAFVECTSPTSRYNGQFNFLDYSHQYCLDGTGVDFVVQDSGIEANHPEWLNRDGTASRLKQIDWPSASGLSGLYTQGANHYTDQYGHGTHCAGTVAGRLYGWANNADIYSIKIFDTDAFAPNASFNMIRGWHNLKGTGRPTVVNMSWGYLNRYATSGAQYSTTWRGTEYVVATNQAQYGQIRASFDGSGYRYPDRVTSIDSDVEDCIAAGIVLVGAAGNYYHKIDVPGGLDYDNHYQTTNGGTELYYHRGSSPCSAANVICVGAIDYDYTGGQERQTNFTETGPRVDVFAPGYAVQSAVPKDATLDIGSTYPLDSNFRIRKLQGTSMASPQVCGIVATLLQARPYYTQQDCVNWIQEQAAIGRLYDPSTGTPSTDYQNYYALQGAGNRYLQTPFVSGIPQEVTGGLSISK